MVQLEAAWGTDVPRFRWVSLSVALLFLGSCATAPVGRFSLSEQEVTDLVGPIRCEAPSNHDERVHESVLCTIKYSRAECALLPAEDEFETHRAKCSWRWKEGGRWKRDAAVVYQSQGSTEWQVDRSLYEP